MSWLFRHTSPVMPPAPVPDDPRLEEIRLETKAQRQRIRAQWPQVLEQLSFTQERLTVNDIGGALERSWEASRRGDKT